MLIFLIDLLPFYAILRSIPNKLLGVIAMFSAILILLAMPFTDLSRSRGIQFRPLNKAAFFIFVGNFLILMQLGAKHVESPFIEFGQISTVLYFAHFLIIVPLISLLENSLIELESKKKDKYQTYKYSKQKQNTNKIKNSSNTSSTYLASLFFFNWSSLPLPFLFQFKFNPSWYLYAHKVNKYEVLVLAGLFFIYYLFSLSNSSPFPITLCCDAPRPWGIYFQDSATPQMEALMELHDNILFYLSIILFGVGWILISIIIKFNNKKWPIANKYLNHGTLIELIWTITPALILILIAFPSFKLLYLMDEVNDPSMVVLAEGFSIRKRGGLKLHILNKIKDTSIAFWLVMSNTGEKNNSLVPRLAQVQGTSFFKNKFKIQNLKFCFTNLPAVYFYRTFHTKVKASNRIGPHNEEVISVIIGSLLGDCYASARTIEGTRFSYRQSKIHKDYLFWLYEFYYSRGYCSNLKPRMYTRRLTDKKSKYIKEYYGYEFNTFTFRSFNWITKMFYKKGKKIVSAKLEQYFTPLALAILIMDDGCWAKPGVRLATNSFKLNDVQFLADLLKKLFDLNCTIQKINTPGQYSIYIKAESVLKLRKLVLPYIIPSMRYKLGL